MDLSKSEVVNLLTLAMQDLQEHIGSEAPAQRVLTFLAIAGNHDLPQYDLEKLIKGFSPATFSRNVADLSSTKRDRRPGPNLIAQMPDPMYRRRNLLRLTDKGNDLIDAITRRVNAALAKHHAASSGATADAP